MLYFYQVNAQKYWLGGSGNWADPLMWATTPNGNPGAGAPSINDEVIIQTAHTTTINIHFNAQKHSARSIKFTTDTKIIFTSDENAELFVVENLHFPTTVENQFEGTAHFYNFEKNAPPNHYKKGQFYGLNLPTILKNSLPQTLEITGINYIKEDLKCPDSNNGFIEITEVFGGSGNYTYQWFPSDPAPDGQGTNRIYNLTGGFYIVQIYDVVNPDDEDPFTEVVLIASPVPIVINRLNTINVSCFGGNNGRINTSVFNGTQPYSFLWNDPANQTTQNATNLSAGVYRLSVTDADGCVANSVNWTVSQPDTLIVSFNDTMPISCFGVCDGEITAVASGGTPGYSFNWLDLASSDAHQNNLCAGEYELEIVDSSNCKDTLNYILVQPDPIDVQVIRTNITCFGLQDGAARAEVTGGFPPFAFNWYDVPGAPTDTAVSNLSAGPYNLAVTDDNGCTDTVPFTITQNPPITKGFTDVSNIACNGDCDGTARIVSGGGALPHTYRWYTLPGVPTVDSVGGLCAGTYSVAIRDAANCLDTASITINQPAQPLVLNIVDSLHNLCFGDCNGIIEIEATGGSGLKNYLWLNLPDSTTDNRITDLCNGTYTAIVIDQNACIDSLDFEIISPEEYEASLAITPISCGGTCDGIVEINSTGGVAPYSFDWYDLGDVNTDSIATDLCVGTYHVEITDANACVDTIPVNLNQPPILRLFVDSITPVLCKNSCTGAATTFTVGGLAPYTYSWIGVPGNPTTPNVGNLCAGTYRLAVRDASNCVDTLQLTITEPLTELVVSITDSIGNDCFGDCNGEAIGQAIGGTGDYVFNWYNAGGQDSARALNLCAGIYFLAVGDENGCKDTASVSIAQPLAPVSANIIDSTDLVCYSGCIGTATVGYAGGMAPYTVNWINLGNADTDLVENLCAGTYVVQVTDTLGCSDQTSVTINQPLPFEVSLIDSVIPTCYGDCDGALTISTSGGTGVNTIIQWINIAGNPNTAKVNNLCADDYFVEVMDENMCRDTLSVALNQADSIIWSIASSTNVDCKGNCNGQVTLAVSGGLPVVGVQWLNTPGLSNGLSENNLCAGNYNFRIEDANACVVNGSVTITEPDSLLLDIQGTNLTCNGDSSGSALALVTGGVLPYTYLWVEADSATTANIDSLVAGTYTVQVRDARGCTVTDQIVITQPQTLQVNLVDTSTASCLCNGAIEVAGVGGTGLYSYLWNDPDTQTVASIHNLCAGEYQVWLKDENNCRDSLTIDIGDTNALVINFTNVTPTSCFNTCNGSATAEVTKGVGPFSYEWNNAANTTSATANNLCRQTYTVQVTDGGGCIALRNVFISSPPAINTLTETILPTCFGLENGAIKTTAYGGVAPYTHSWNTGATVDSIFNLAAGLYTNTIRDANNCVLVRNVNLPNPPELIASIIDSSDALCFGSNDGTAEVGVIGGATPYSYSWYTAPNPSDSAKIVTLPSGTFFIAVTDTNSCSDTVSVVINQPLDFSYVKDSVWASCNGICDGAASFTVNGGTAPYQYLWLNTSGNLTSNNESNLCVGTYTIQVTDTNACLETFQIGVAAPVVVQAQVDTVIDVSCAGSCNGSATVSASGGVAPYTYEWVDFPDVSTATNNNLCEGQFEVIIRDDNGCMDNVWVTVGATINFSYTVNTQNLRCFKDSSGSIQLTVQGGNEPYQFDWFTLENQNTAALGNLVAGIYRIQIRDNNNCLDTLDVLLSQPDTISIVFTSDTLQCFEDENAHITAAVAGGTAPYSFLWDDALATTSALLNNVGAGNYNLSVTDTNNCTATKLFVLSQPDSITLEITDAVMTNCGCTGSATVLANGGVGNYVYQWDDPASQQGATATNLCAGTYTVTVRDSNLCVGSVMVTILDTSTFALQIVDNNPVACKGACNGSAQVSVLNGTAPYTYLWNDIANTTDALVSNLCPGTYQVTVSDALGCVDSINVLIEEPVLALSFSEINRINSACNTCDGSAEVNVLGGTGEYRYAWQGVSGDSTVSVVSNLCVGQYFLEVSDENGCTIDTGITIFGGDSLTISILDIQMNSCFQSCDGYMEVIGSGGTAPYTYSWDNLTDTTNRIGDLCAASYKVTLSDANGCTAEITRTITQPDRLMATITESAHSDCNPCNGGATVGATGGTGQYTYNWWTLGRNTQSIDSICPGFYQVRVSDENACNAVATAIINSVDGFSVSLEESANETCFGACDGWAKISVINGGNYTVVWDDPSNSATDSVTNLCRGLYQATITNENACAAFVGVEIDGPQSIQAQISDQLNAGCIFGEEGYAVLGVADGVVIQSVQWNDLLNQTTDTAFNLVAGNYQVVVTDIMDCKDSTQVNILQGNPITVNYVNIQDVTCSGFCNGEATLDLGGGSGNFEVLWTNGDTALTSVTLCEGTQHVRINDGVCVSNDSVTIGNADPLIPEITQLNNLCFGDCNGSITVNIQGGTAPYTHNWNTGDNSNSLLNLCSDVYVDTISDVNGCFIIENIVLMQPTPLIHVIDTTPLSCFNSCDGEIKVSVTGGVYPYMYTWNNGLANDSVFSNLCANEYILELVDANNCVLNDTITLKQPLAITVQLLSAIAPLCYDSCNGEIAISVAGGIGNLALSWDNFTALDTLSNLCAGNYSLTVVDEQNCRLDTNFTLTEPSAIQVDLLSLTDNTCATQAIGAINLEAQGGTGALTYLWDDALASTNLNLTDLDSGEYRLLVKDSNNCTVTQTYWVNLGDVLSAAYKLKQVSCFEQCNGSVLSEVNGGVGAYDYLWSTNSINNQITALCAGTYSVEITDEVNCTLRDTFEIVEPNELILSVQKQVNLACANTCEGVLELTATGGLVPYIVEWDDDANRDSLRGVDLCAGLYTITVTDSNECVVQNVFTLTQPDSIVTSISFDQATCVYSFDASASVVASGGQGELMYEWFNAGDFTAKNTQITGITTGVYYVRVRDENDCFVVDSVEVDEQYFVLADAGTDQIICFGDTVNLMGTGGLSGFWNVGGNNSILSIVPQETTVYTYTAVNNNCIDKADVIITVLSNPQAQILSSSEFALRGGSVVLEGDGGSVGAQYLWEPAAILSQNQGKIVSAFPTQNTLIILTVINPAGCSDSTSLLLQVAESIVFPDGISPNGDGLNDTWRIDLIEEFPESVVEIYNRWGQLVFRSIGYTDQWDGTFEGKDLPVGTYYFVINLGKDLPQYKGPITLMR